MKIGQPSELPALVSQVNAPAAQKAGAASTAKTQANAPASTKSAGVAVTVSTQARALEQADVAEVDTQKVAKVRTQIEQGTYKVNAEAIADKLLSNAQEMLKRTTS
ncbi:flagellar biosynthesis anti-sigma factor FlgM [Rhodoferax aquaticus]|uniref:Negative regulator of flagellin synthesis n=1 Tax=Rhodoferax aquaticus TaxID=2527691 RepID=A0A515ETV3_9BURK|nr:flagellar biosynthesis anti-sigma factor FlgM [Rhodoferax aquaticus]QDL56106.1 flagellar biosynthesis anti-sigma factor FlgM [Rhodoferax aquaticus]